jgi:hypothetical protein
LGVADRLEKVIKYAEKTQLLMSKLRSSVVIGTIDDPTMVASIQIIARLESILVWSVSLGL